MRTLAFLFGLFFATCAFAQSPIGEVFCDERSSLIEKLKVSYGAERQGRGTRGPDALVEVWMNRSTGDWTLVQSYANGNACVVAMGENWETIAQPSDPA